MIQKALVMLLLFAVTIVGSLLFFVNLDTVSADRPLPLREVVGGTDDLAQWKVKWVEPDNAITSIGVIMNEPDVLQVRVDYKYAGEHGTDVFACGSIGERVDHVNWTCKPMPVKVGESTVVLEFQTSNQAQREECSKYVVVKFYQAGEMPFYSNYYHYKKAWIKDASGMWGRFQQFFHSCEV